MQLRQYCLQLLALLMTLTAHVQWSTAEIPCPQINSGTVPSSPASPSRLTLNPSPEVFSPSLLSPEDDAACIGKRSLSALITVENAALLGFQSPEEFKPDSVTIGDPFDLYQVDLVDLRRFNPTTDDNVTDLIKLNKGVRIYPLRTKRQGDGPDAKARAAVVVSKKGDKWIPTHLGLAQLARDMDEFRRVHGFEDGFVVWIPALNLHFLAKDPRQTSLNSLLLIPLANRLAYGIRRGQQISAKTVFTFYAREANALDDNNPG